MVAHEVDKMASRFPESLSEVQISEISEKAISVATTFGLGVFQGNVLFLNLIQRLNFTRKARIVTLTRKNCQHPSLFTNFKIRHKYKGYHFLLHWLVYANVIIHLSVDKIPVYSLRQFSRLGEYPGLVFA